MSDDDYTEFFYVMRRSRYSTFYISQEFISTVYYLSCSLGNEEVQRQAEDIFRETWS